MKSRSKSVCILVPLIIILLGVKSVNAQLEVEDEREFDYGVNSKKGPSNWGWIKKEWSACKDGRMQSPIDMSSERVRLISKPDRPHYKAANATVKNRGHDIQIEWKGDAGSLHINGTNYPLRYAHWHSPSEHSINGRRFAMELHLVHLNIEPNVTNRIAVVGILYTIGKPDKFLSRLMLNISSIRDEKNEESVLGRVNPKEIGLGCKMYYRYMGSLTVPPCTEGVIWTLHRKIKTVSWEQVRLLREAVHDYAEQNARPVQHHNHRDIYKYITLN